MYEVTDDHTSSMSHVGCQVLETWNNESVAELSISEYDALSIAIADFGERSACAQGLRAAITTLDRVVHENQTLILQYTSRLVTSTVAGGIKTGHKRLFLVTDNGQYIPTSALCVLDFYVHETCQRSGVGKVLFDAMLKHHGVAPVNLAYDRPSSKLISFLAKHYDLVQQCPQPNKFLIFQGFFPGRVSTSGRPGDPDRCQHIEKSCSRWHDAPDRSIQRYNHAQNVPVDKQLRQQDPRPMCGQDGRHHEEELLRTSPYPMDRCTDRCHHQDAETSHGQRPSHAADDVEHSTSCSQCIGRLDSRELGATRTLQPRDMQGASRRDGSLKTSSRDGTHARRAPHQYKQQNGRLTVKHASTPVQNRSFVDKDMAIIE